MNRGRTLETEDGGRRLLLISEYFPPRVFGGGEVSALRLAHGLAARGFEIWVLTTGAPELAEDEIVDGVRVIRRLRSGPTPRSIASNVLRVMRLPGSIRREATRLTSRVDFDAVLLLNATSIVPLRLAPPTIAVVNGYTPFCPKGTLYFQERTGCGGCAPRKFVACITRSEFAGMSRMPWYLRFNPLFWLGLYTQYRRRRRALAGVDHFVAISGFVAGVLHGHGVPQHRIARIYNIAEIEDGGDDVPDELAEAMAGRRVVTFLGKLEKLKGPELAIRGFAAWRSGDDLLLLAGEGSQRPSLEALCRRLGVRDAVRFAGQVPARFLPYVYRQSYAIVLPSQWPEPFSRVVMEAAFFGRPLLASARGGNRDLPAAHLFSTAEELAAKLDRPPVPDFTPYDPAANLDRFVELVTRLRDPNPAAARGPR